MAGRLYVDSSLGRRGDWRRRPQGTKGVTVAVFSCMMCYTCSKLSFVLCVPAGQVCVDVQSAAQLVFPLAVRYLVFGSTCTELTSQKRCKADCVCMSKISVFVVVVVVVVGRREDRRRRTYCK